ncbi:MAG: DUF222 domain-containing protein [Actinomycetia bacterium]|nr:DUF222 domain-containing protein [Actinomycetes bacterium]
MCPLSLQLQEISRVWAQSQHQLVVTSAVFADSDEWILAGKPTPAHWLAETADVEVCTAREWIRIGRKLRCLPVTADAFATGAISYSKVRTLTRLATPDNEAELVDLASGVPAGELRRSLALWLKARMSPKEFEDHQHSRRSVTWRTEADGMIRFTLRLEPLIAATLISLLAKIVMRPKPRPATSESWPTAAQQHADAFNEVLSEGAGAVDTEVVVHVRADGATLADGTPIADTVVERIAPKSFIRALIHDANGKPVDASNRRRHPTTRQKRVINERDSHTCVDCGRSDLLNYHHHPDYGQTNHTVTAETELRCAPCHHRHHNACS